MDDRHPILRHRAFIIPSPPVREFETTLKRKLNSGELSLCVYGPPRVGKTSALQYVAHKFTKARRAVIRKATFESQQMPTRVDRADFWRAFLPATSAPPANWRSPAGAYSALLKSLTVDSEAKRTDTILIAVEEAQNLVAHHYSMLKRLVDELIDLGRNPFLLLSAQPEIQDRPDMLLQQNKHDLVDRFFTQWHRMRGLKLDEFEGFLRAYDELRWPSTGSETETSSLTFTAYFAPELAANGGLVTVAPYFQDYFRAMNRDIGGQPEAEVETKYLVAAIRIFLLRLNAVPSLQVARTAGATIKESIQQCGIIESRRRVGNAEQLFQTGKGARKRPLLEL